VSVSIEKIIQDYVYNNRTSQRRTRQMLHGSRLIDVNVRRDRLQQCVKAPSEGICSKSTICDFQLMVNSNRG